MCHTKRKPMNAKSTPCCHRSRLTCDISSRLTKECDRDGILVETPADGDPLGNDSVRRRPGHGCRCEGAPATSWRPDGHENLRPLYERVRPSPGLRDVHRAI